MFQRVEASAVRCPDDSTSVKMIELIDLARQKGDTLGGIFKVVVSGVPAGLGSHIQWDKKTQRPPDDGCFQHSGNQGGRDRPRIQGCREIRLGEMDKIAY